MAIVPRPFALIGRSALVDLPVPCPKVSLRHVYVHLDHRGVFAVDLASRTGTRFDDAPAGSRVARLRPGRGLDLGDYRVELLDTSPDLDPRSGLAAVSPLAEVAGLVPLELRPEDDPGHPLALLSTLSFLGRSRSCAIPIEGDEVARVHAVIVRSRSEAFVVNLSGKAPMINGLPAVQASPLRDGDLLELGRRRFVARLGPSSGLAVVAGGSLGTAKTPTGPPEDPGQADLARILRGVRDGQDELARTNDQFQQGLIAAVRQIYQEQSDLFERHLDRLDRLQQEMAELRAELRERLGPSPPNMPSPGDPGALPPPASPPLEVPGTSQDPGPGRATSWLIDRLGDLEEKVEQESRSGWRDLLSKLGPPPRERNGG